MRAAGRPPRDSRPSGWDADVVREHIRPHIRELAAEWGVRFTGKRSPKGWLECHAVGREDASPSAAGDENTGNYKDQGGSCESLSVFGLAIRLGAFRDFPAAVNGLGERFNAPRSAGNPFVVRARGESPFAGKATSSAGPKAADPPKRIGHPTFEDAVAALARSPKLKRDKAEYQAHWTYLKADESESLRVARFRVAAAKGKTYRPLYRDPEAGWLAMDPPGLLPLYNLPRLREAGPVWVFEGEKVADLAVGLGLLATTSAHGAGSASKSDWSPLAGREVVVVPDHGDAGGAYLAEVVKQLGQVQPRPSVRVLRLPGLEDSEDLEQWLERAPDGWDEEHCRRELERLADAATDPEPQPEPDPATIPITNPFDLGILGMVAFSGATYPREWLIKRIMVKGKPGVIGGPKKALKTSFIIDLAVSLGGAGQFLGQFDVPRPIRTLVISGESGEATIQETMRRVCRSKEVHPPDLEGFVFWGFKLPQLGCPDELKSMGEFIRSNQVECVIIDPLYLCLISGVRRIDPANLFDVGPLLKTVCDICLDAGATPLLVHHFRKNRETPFGVPEMEDMAFAGIQEFARQWILIGRRERYEPGSGEHQLWLSVGGSDGHSGEWSVDVSEGTLAEDFRDREWRVSITTAVEAIGKAKEKEVAGKADKAFEAQKARDEARKRKSHDDAEAALDVLAKAPGRMMTKNALRDQLCWSGSRISQAVEILLRQGRIRAVESVEFIGDDNKKRSSPGYQFVTEVLPDDPF